MATQRGKTAGKTDSPGMEIEFEGRKYVVRQSDITAQDARALRQETGYSWLGLMREAEKDFDIDLIAAILWFARRLDGDTVSYDDVMSTVSYDDAVKISVEDKRTPAVEVESGEA